MTIIRHANPTAAMEIDAESKWIEDSLPLETVHRSGVLNLGAGDMYLNETSSEQIRPIALDHWLFQSRITTQRRQGHNETINRVVRTCDVWPKKVDWSTAALRPYSAPIGKTGSIAYSVTVTADKGALCDEVWPDSKSHSEGTHIIFMLFQRESSARQFIQNMTDHFRSVLAQQSRK
jgi:hypothetical protein